VTLINWLLKSKCMLNIFWIFPLMYEDTIFILFLRDFAVCTKTKHFIFIFFLWKPGILIPDLYLYSIKKQTNIDQNAVKYTRKSQKVFWKYFLNLLLFFYLFFLGWVQLGPCGWAGPSSPVRVTGPTQWPGCLRPACVNYSRMQCTVRR